MEEATILIETYLNSLINDIAITAITDQTGDVWRISCNAPKNIVVNDKVTIGNYTYRVVATSYKIYIEVSATAEPVGSTIKKALKIYKGIHTDIDQERVKSLTAQNTYKFPYCAIFEPDKNDFNVEDDYPAGKQSKVYCVFMDEYSKDFTIDNHYDYAVKPMVRWAELLLGKMKDKEGGELNVIKKFSYENKIKWSLFAKYPNWKEWSQIFKEDATGIECFIDFEISPEINLIGCLY